MDSHKPAETSINQHFRLPQPNYRNSLRAVVLEVTPSENFRATTWLLLETGAEIVEVLAEELYDQPTTYPIDPSLNGVSADYALFRAAQQGGIQAVKQYMNEHCENAAAADVKSITERAAALREVRKIAKLR